MYQEMEMDCEENVYNLNFTEEFEQSRNSMFDTSAQSLNETENPYQYYDDSSLLFPNFGNPEGFDDQSMQENQIREQNDQEMNEDDKEIQEDEMNEQNDQEIQEYQLTEQYCDQNEENQNQEEQHPLYKLNEVDTESSIRTEIKQLILTKVSDEIKEVFLSCSQYEIENQLENLNTRIDQTINKLQDIENDIESDNTRLVQSEDTLQKTNEMVSLLKQNVNKLQCRLKNSQINYFLEKITHQTKIIALLKEINLSKLKNEKAKLIALKTSNTEKSERSELELRSKQESLSKLKNKVNDLRQIILAQKNEIDKNMTKKNMLEEKLVTLRNNKANPSEFVEQKNLFKVICAKKEVLIAKCKCMDDKKVNLEEELTESLQNLEEIKTNIEDDERQISEKNILQAELESQLKELKSKNEETLKQMQQDYEDITGVCNESLSTLSNYELENNQLRKKLNNLNNSLFDKNQEKLVLLQDGLQRQDMIHKVKLEISKKQTTNEMEGKKIEELRSQHLMVSETLRSLENNISKEKEAIEHEITEMRTKVNIRQAETMKISSEMKKRREYMMANANFLREKANNLQNEVNDFAASIKNLQDENESITTSMEKKMDYLNECKSKVDTLKKNQYSNLKSLFKSSKENISKKVKFNEILSFKSTTSSENSSVPVNIATQLETSLHEWLQDSKNSSGSSGNIEKYLK